MCVDLLFSKNLLKSIKIICSAYVNSQVHGISNKSLGQVLKEALGINITEILKNYKNVCKYEDDYRTCSTNNNALREDNYVCTTTLEQPEGFEESSCNELCEGDVKDPILNPLEVFDYPIMYKRITKILNVKLHLNIVESFAGICKFWGIEYDDKKPSTYYTALQALYKIYKPLADAGN